MLCLCSITVVIGGFRVFYRFSSLLGRTRMINKRRKRLSVIFLLSTFSTLLVEHFSSSEIPISLYRHVDTRGNSRDASGFVSRDLAILAGPCWHSSCPGWRSLGFRGPGTRNSLYKASC